VLFSLLFSTKIQFVCGLFQSRFICRDKVAFRLKKHRFSDSFLRGWSGNVSPTALELCYSSPGVLLQDSWSDVTGLLEKSYGGLGKK
jgi:hypothetical protein